MNSTISQQISTLAGYDERKTQKVRVLSHYHGAQRISSKPHHPFHNWSRLFQLPWFCFLDIAIFCLYFLFAYFHECSSISFTLDITKAINQYFYEEIDLVEPPIGIPIGDGQIYFIDDFLIIFNKISAKLFNFSETFPMSHPILPAPNIDLQITLQNGTIINDIINDDDDDNTTTTTTTTKTIATAPSDLVIPFILTFSKVSITMKYHIQITSQTQDSRMNLEIICMFTHDPRTDTILVDLKHTRFQEKFIISAGMIIQTFNYSIPFIIIFLNVTSLFVLFNTTRRLVGYARLKSVDIGLKSTDIFWSKLDKWTIFGGVTNVLSIVACIAYILIGQDIEKEVPPISIFMSISTCLHCLLLIRYLSLKESTMLIVNVLFKALIQLMKFLVGCLPIFIGFWVLGICLFGHLAVSFASPMQCASYLFCVMHGDSIIGFYDSTIVQNDYSPYLGFIYSSTWLFFALLLMFNITISIVQGVLAEETLKMSDRHKDQNQPLHFNILANDINLMLNRDRLT